MAATVHIRVYKSSRGVDSTHQVTRSTATAAPRTLVGRQPRALAPRRLFSDVQEPLGTLLRLGVLSFGAGGWVGMAGIRLSLAILVYTFAVLAFPARRTLVGVGHELDAMLAEGQGGFSDIMKSAIARKR
jgi:hypothetical protein